MKFEHLTFMIRPTMKIILKCVIRVHLRIHHRKLKMTITKHPRGGFEDVSPINCNAVFPWSSSFIGGVNFFEA